MRRISKLHLDKLIRMLASAADVLQGSTTGAALSAASILLCSSVASISDEDVREQLQKASLELAQKRRKRRNKPEGFLQLTVVEARGLPKMD